MIDVIISSEWEVYYVTQIKLGLLHHCSDFRTSRPQCSIKNVDLFNDEKMAQIQKYQGMNVDELSATAEREYEKMRAAEEMQSFMRSTDCCPRRRMMPSPESRRPGWGC